MVEDLQALDYGYDQVVSGLMLFRVYIRQHAKVYAAVTVVLLQDFVNRRYSELYQGLAEGVRLHLHPRGLLPRSVCARRVQHEGQVHALL